MQECDEIGPNIIHMCVKNQDSIVATEPGKSNKVISILIVSV